MGRLFTYGFFLVLMTAMTISRAGYARDGHDAGVFLHGMRVAVPLDTVPAQKKPPAEKPQDLPDNSIPDVIKEVPKSRRVIKPVAIPAPLPVKPIRIIKPKIIKRTVGLIG